jgi:hypothetical protein
MHTAAQLRLVKRYKMNSLLLQLQKNAKAMAEMSKAHLFQTTTCHMMGFRSGLERSQKTVNKTIAQSPYTTICGTSGKLQVRIQHK